MNESGTMRRCHCRCNVSSPIALRVVGLARPHSGEAVGLQLDAHGQRVRLRAHLVDLCQDAEHVLDVVTDLVRDDVGLREVAGRLEGVPQLLV